MWRYPHPYILPTSPKMMTLDEWSEFFKTTLGISATQIHELYVLVNKSGFICPEGV